MSKKITFSAFGRDSYYHREWFKKHGFKFDRSSKKWTVYAISTDHAEEYASYCREYGLNFERSDRDIENFNYVLTLSKLETDSKDSPFELCFITNCGII